MSNPTAVIRIAVIVGTMMTNPVLEPIARADAPSHNVPMGFTSAFLKEFPQGQFAEQIINDDEGVRGFIQRDSRHSLSLAQRIGDKALLTTKFQHFYDGIEVIGSMTFLHQGTLRQEIRNLLAEFDLDARPVVTAEDAVAIARNAVGNPDLVLEKYPELKILPDPQRPSEARLIYWVTVASSLEHAGYDVLIDAHNGELLANLSRHLTLAPIDVFTTQNAGSRCQTLNGSGAPASIDARSCNHVIGNSTASSASADASAQRAASNSQAVLQYYLTHHNRNSYDDRGSDVVSVVHIGSHFDNAFWAPDLKIMAYGDGDGQTFGDFTTALDVAGHEMTHGVTSETAKLLNMGESGALNEANSDFFGKMIANDGDWAIGRKLFLNPNNNGVRDLEDPSRLSVNSRDSRGNITGKRPYPSTLAQEFPVQGTCDSTNDNCWVHINSTIPGHASYLVTQAIGSDKAERLYYLTLTHYLNAQATLKTAAQAVQSACQQLFDSGTCSAVHQAYASVGF